MQQLRHIGVAMMVMGLLALATGCQKKCQAPAETAFKSLSATEWRLVETTDPQVAKDLTKHTFLVVVYKNDFKGEIFLVQNNTRYDTPERIFTYNVDPETERLTAAYSSPTATSTQSAGAVNYSYSLGRELELFEEKTGYYHRFVPMLGIVEPDDKCTF